MMGWQGVNCSRHFKGFDGGERDKEGTTMEIYLIN